MGTWPGLRPDQPKSERAVRFGPHGPRSRRLDGDAAVFAVVRVAIALRGYGRRYQRAMVRGRLPPL